MKKAALMLACMFAAYTLFGQTHWPKPTNFSGSVTANSVLVINGEESLADYIEIGAFCGEECRGAALPYGTLVAGHRIYFLSIAGNTNGQTITFRLWDHQSNKELEYECQTTVNFQDNLILGQIPNDLFEIGFTVPQTTVTQPIRLSKGWNWISTYIEMDPMELLEALETALGEVGLQIKSRHMVTSWDADEEEWSGGLQNVGLSNGNTYMVETSTACTVTLQGPAPDPADYTITLNPKAWTWIGFPCAVEVDIEDALAGFVAMPGDQLKSRHQASSWDEEEEEWSGGIMKLIPGTGYMFYSNGTEVRSLIFQTSRGTK